MLAPTQLPIDLIERVGPICVRSIISQCKFRKVESVSKTHLGVVVIKPFSSEIPIIKDCADSECTLVD